MSEVWAHTASLTGLSRLWVAGIDGKVGPIALPREVINSLDRPEPQCVPANNPETLATQRWLNFLRDLTRDADASFFEEVTDENKVA